jgi:GntR family transcriptional regulator/MocR family aminotransferase
MVRRPASVLILDFDKPNGSSPQPLVVRVESRIRSAIMSGSLAPGSRLPSSRILAQDLKVSRHTVEWAFTQLQAEGFVIRRRGSGTFVARDIPEREQPPETPLRRARPPLLATLSRRGAVMASFPGFPEPLIGRAFIPSIPAVELFPRQIWQRLVGRALQRPGMTGWAYGPTGGLPELREAIAAHVSGTRGVVCAPDQVVIVSSGHQAIDLAARILLDPGDTVWVENPCYPTATRLFRAADAEVVPVPVDQEGFDVAAARAINPQARLAYVTPSHQYPTGAHMPLARRTALVAWAEREQGWIIEDDYDGDFRYAGRPLAALQALDSAGRVLYLGTFNKMMFPGLRLAFMVVPPGLIDPSLGAKHTMDAFAPGHTQAALAEFIREGHLATHLRRLVVEYDRRRRALLAALETVSDELEVGHSEGGMHLTVYLRRPLDERAIVERCGASGVTLSGLSRFYQGCPRHGFVLGFACASPSRIHAAMRTVAQQLRKA